MVSGASAAERPVHVHPAGRIQARGSWLHDGGVPFRVRGVTYGTFRSRSDGARYPPLVRIQSDFSCIAQHGLNTVRVYTVPPDELLDAAAEHGLRVLVGLDYDDWRMVDGSGRRATQQVLANGLRAVERALERCDGRPEVLAISVGNEVPVDLVRLHGSRRVERCLERLIDAVHDGAPELLATYTNYPSSEFLDPGAQDLVTWNVFLEDRGALDRYLHHLLVLAGDRPLLLTEFGLSAGIHGEAAQARSLHWQIEAAVSSGCSGGTVFAWTDEWAVADEPVTNWDFGVTRCNRTPKPALAVLASWPKTGALPEPLPGVSVVVCAYNEAGNVDRCLRSILLNDYPELEVIVCDDGSEDDTALRASRYPVRLLRLEHGGLSAARNAGMAAATGDIVAYLDADAEAGPDWVAHLVAGFRRPGVVAVGGPNHPFDGVPCTEAAVAASPGNPREVLLGDVEAEHIAGCNMAFLRKALLDLGGFDVAYRTAGDDVDVCWRVLESGGAIAFAPAAAVLHHRRGTVKGYLRQQRGYGRAERMLQGPHRERFNKLGQARWRGFVYGGLSLSRRFLGSVVYHGSFGLQPFQPVCSRRGEAWFVLLLALMPLLTASGAALLAVGAVLTSPPVATLGLLLATVPPAGVAVGAFASARPPGTLPRTRFRLLVALLHVLQPHVRCWGRLTTRPLPERRVKALWSGDRMAFLGSVARCASVQGWRVLDGGEHDAHDLDLRRRFVRGRVNVATVWQWTPRWSIRSGPRPVPTLVGLLALVAGVAVASIPPALAAVVATAATLDSAWSICRLRRSIERVAAAADLATDPRHERLGTGDLQPDPAPGASTKHDASVLR